MYKNSRQAKEIIALQKENGAWGYFHSLSEPRKCSFTTEYALRRLSAFGYTIEDEPIQRAVKYLNDCLTRKAFIPDRREKGHNWDIFSDVMFSTWIRRFVPDNEPANQTAKKWAAIISAAFSGGEYDHSRYIAAFQDSFLEKPRGGRAVDFVSFYFVSLTSDQYDDGTAERIFDHQLNKKDGIYYIYDAQISVLPTNFESKQASRYLGAIELLSEYDYAGCKKRLQFVADWLNAHKNQNCKWDMGAGVRGGNLNDKVYFPLSDSWRKKEDREKDCTYRVRKLLDALNTSE